MSLMRKEDEGEGIEVAWEDQQRINAFSKFNTRLTDIEGELKGKLEEKELYDDLEMELELADEDSAVLYKLSSTYFHLPPASALKQLKSERKELKREIKELEKKKEGCLEGMKGLRVELYAKFGNQINLELDPKDD